mgnify:CR=1 FL=1
MILNLYALRATLSIVALMNRSYVIRWHHRVDEPAVDDHAFANHDPGARAADSHERLVLHVGVTIKSTTPEYCVLPPENICHKAHASPKKAY